MYIMVGVTVWLIDLVKVWVSVRDVDVARVLLATDPRHQEVLRTETEHHSEALTRREHQRVRGILLETRERREEARESLGVGIACDLAQLEHPRHIQDRR